MSFDATLTWWFTAILAVISLFALISTRSVSRRESLMQRFTDEVVLPVGDEAVVATVQRRVVSLARAYAFGTLVGLAVFAALIALQPALASPRSLIQLCVPLAIVGGGIGSVIVVLRDSLFRPRPEMPRIARTVAPTISDYVSPLSRGITLVPLVAAAVAAVVYGVLAVGGAFEPDAVISGQTVALVVVAVGSAIAAHFLSLRVLERPQPAENTLELAWDDALRAEALLTLLSLVGILSWIACSAVVYAVATGVDPGSPFTEGIVPQLSGLGMLSIVYFAAFGGGKKHFRFRLWPDIDAVNTSGLTA